ncbi:CopG family transcriptional regulator [Sphingobium tyrosinilyticum]|uniref:CopG family transcriptional regulator n=1 Tax=Sphingobium tyrosinilyticum TaxID=2715436 RepID=A0ABV9F5U3_9SPHN
MPVITIQLEEELHRRLKRRAATANLSISALVRPLIEDVAVGRGGYIFTGLDELMGVAVQTYALLAEMAVDHSPQLLARGTANARLMLRDRGLLDPSEDPLADIGRVGSRQGEDGQ